jgi:hypothetical protein
MMRNPKRKDEDVVIVLIDSYSCVLVSVHRHITHYSDWVAQVLLNAILNSPPEAPIIATITAKTNPMP